MERAIARPMISSGGTRMDAKILIRELTDGIERTANVKAVFGEPVGDGLESIIPVARISVRGGGGGGLGEDQEGDRNPGKGRGTGVGIGLNVVSSPVGYIRRTSDGPTFVPIVDRNRLILAVGLVASLGIIAVSSGLRSMNR